MKTLWLVVGIWALVQTLLLVQDCGPWEFAGVGTVALSWYFIGFYRPRVKT